MHGKVIVITGASGALGNVVADTRHRVRRKGGRH